MGEGVDDRRLVWAGDDDAGAGVGAEIGDNSGEPVPLIDRERRGGAGRLKMGSKGAGKRLNITGEAADAVVSHRASDTRGTFGDIEPVHLKIGLIWNNTNSSPIGELAGVA